MYCLVCEIYCPQKIDTSRQVYRYWKAFPKRQVSIETGRYQTLHQNAKTLLRRIEPARLMERKRGSHL